MRRDVAGGNRNRAARTKGACAPSLGKSRRPESRRNSPRCFPPPARRQLSTRNPEGIGGSCASVQTPESPSQSSDRRGSEELFLDESAPELGRKPPPRSRAGRGGA